MAKWNQTARYFQQPKKERGGMGGSAGGGYPYNNAFRQEIRLTDKPQRLLFIDKGSYPGYEDSSVTLPYWEKVRHSFSEMRGGKRYFRSYLCPKGADRKVSCRSCTMQYDEDDSRVSSRRIKYFPVVSLEYWFKVTNKYNDEIWVLPSTPAERRKYESDPNATEVFGRLGYIALGNGHFNQLMDIIDHVGQQCVNCMEPGQRPAKLFPAKYTCGFCEHTLCDLETRLRARDVEANSRVIEKMGVSLATLEQLQEHEDDRVYTEAARLLDDYFEAETSSPT